MKKLLFILIVCCSINGFGQDLKFEYSCDTVITNPNNVSGIQSSSKETGINGVLNLSSSLDWVNKDTLVVKPYTVMNIGDKCIGISSHLCNKGKSHKHSEGYWSLEISPLKRAF